jgi:4-hydroxy-tetrahydrodipicolinate reductase
MKICLIGYGKMGREIETAAIEKGHEIGLIIDINNQDDLSIEKLKGIDVAIEFTIPGSVVSNVRKCFDAGIPVVTGTTGSHKLLPELIQECRTREKSLFYASNFSIGVNLFFSLNETLAKVMNSFPEYEVGITETHHTQKLDAPSGTAISLADILLKEIERKKSWKLTNTPQPDEIAVEAIREGEIKGFHEVCYDSEIDTIRVNHFAKSRKGFAMGAVMAAEFLHNRKGVFTMRDLLGL